MINKLLYLIIVLNILDCLTFGPFNLPFISSALSILVSFLILPSLYKNKLVFKILFPTSIILILSIISNLFEWGKYNYILNDIYPSPYYIYLFLRYVSFLSFFAIFIIIFRVCNKSNFEKLANFLITLSFFVSLYAIYLYVGNFLDFPNIIPRNRSGTAGFGSFQSLTFTYGFHRAIGTFREPSLFAQWLIFPLLLSFSNFKIKLRNLKKFILSITFLLTGSLAGILSLFISLISYFSLEFILIRRFYFFKLYKSKLLLAFLFIIFLVFINQFFDMNYWETLYERIEPLIKYGITSTNRGYIYSGESIVNPSLFGLGLGNYQILAAEKTGMKTLYSSLSIYISYFNSFGFFGFTIFLGILAYPIYMFLKIISNKKNYNKRLIRILMISYISTLVIASINCEEISIMISLPYSFLIIYCQYIIRKSHN